MYLCRCVLWRCVRADPFWSSRQIHSPNRLRWLLLTHYIPVIWHWPWTQTRKLSWTKTNLQLAPLAVDWIREQDWPWWTPRGLRCVGICTNKYPFQTTFGLNFEFENTFKLIIAIATERVKPQPILKLEQWYYNNWKYAACVTYTTIFSSFLCGYIPYEHCVVWSKNTPANTTLNTVNTSYVAKNPANHHPLNMLYNYYYFICASRGYLLHITIKCPTVPTVTHTSNV